MPACYACRYPGPAMQPFVIYYVYVNSGEPAGSEMYEKLSAMYIALVFWYIHECILLLPAAMYVAGPAGGGPNHRCICCLKPRFDKVI